MINDPYIEIISKTKSLNLDEAVVEQAIDRFIKGGPDKAFFFLVNDKKTPESEAWKLIEEIKKEFKSSYYANALYAGVFMVLFFAFCIILLYVSASNPVLYFFLVVFFLYCTYLTVKNLTRALSIKLNKS
jgi:hypothetical protein